MDKCLVNKQNTNSTNSTSISINNDNHYTNHLSQEAKDFNNISKNKQKLFIETSILDKHPSGRHLSEKLASTIADINSDCCFSGVNIIPASPNHKANKIPYSFSVDQVDNKIYMSDDVYYIKNNAKTFQLTPNTQNIKNSVNTVKHNKNNILSFTQEQKILDAQLTQSIQNKEGFDKIKETISLFHTLKKD